MSLEVKDFENPTDEELAFISQRPWLLEEAKRQGLDTEKVQAHLEGRDPVDHTIVTTDDMRRGNQPPIDPPRDNGQGEPGPQERLGEDIEPDDSPYEEWTVSELKSEIDERNKARADDAKLSTSGNKEALVQRLYEDDATE